MTDHKAESERIMADLGENFIAFEGQTDATMIATAIDALRHATLEAADQTAALVEQQRIANLIALADGFDLGRLPVAAADALISSHNDSFGRVADGIRDEIREGLGLS